MSYKKILTIDFSLTGSAFIDLYYQSTVWNVDVILKNNFLLEIFYRVW